MRAELCWTGRASTCSAFLPVRCLSPGTLIAIDLAADAISVATSEDPLRTLISEVVIDVGGIVGGTVGFAVGVGAGGIPGFLTGAVGAAAGTAIFTDEIAPRVDEFIFGP